MLCILCHKQINKQRGKVRHVHTKCMTDLHDDLYNMREEISKAISKEKLLYNIKNRYKWMMDYEFPIKLK